MRLIKPVLMMVLLFNAHPASAQILNINEKEQGLLGIRMQTVTAIDQGGAGVITMRVSIVPDGEWVVKTPLPGVLQRVFVQQGDRVEAGDPLMMVRSGAMVDLQRDYLKARAEVQLQHSVWKRDQQLADAGSISQRRWQETRYNYESAKAELAGLRGQLLLVGVSEIDLQDLENKMDIGPDITLRAPVDAVVLDRQAMLGDQLNGSELLIRLGESQKFILDGNIPYSIASDLSIGSLIELEDSYLRAELTYISSEIDPRTQTLMIRATPLEAANLMLGQLTRWKVLSDGAVLTIPSSAVVKLDGKDIVYVSVPTGFEVRNVDVKSTAGGAWIVMGGLHTGDRIVVVGTAALKAMSIGMGGGEG